MIRISSSAVGRRLCAHQHSSSKNAISSTSFSSVWNAIPLVESKSNDNNGEHRQQRMMSQSTSAYLGSAVRSSSWQNHTMDIGSKRHYSVSRTACAPIVPEDELLRQKAEESVAKALAETEGILYWEPSWYNPADQMIELLNYVQISTGVPYALGIMGMTVAMRALMFPLFVQGQRNNSRMAHLKPEMDVLKDKMDRLGKNVDQETQMRMAMQMKALFAKYQCNPLKALIVPIVQAPLFMSFFFGLRKMPDYFPTELSTGGMFWFEDLTQTDPLYILPIASIASFLIMIELGKDAMTASNPQQGKLMLNFFRGVSVLMIPVTINFSTAVLTYWTVNNSISLAQTVAFRNPTIKKSLDIWEPPKPVPGAAPASDKGIIESLQEVMGNAAKKDQSVDKLERMKDHNSAIEQQKQMDQISKKQSIAGRNRRKNRKKR